MKLLLSRHLINCEPKIGTRMSVQKPCHNVQDELTIENNQGSIESTLLQRYRHYGSTIALFLLSRGTNVLRDVIQLLAAATLTLKTWIAKHTPYSKRLLLLCLQQLRVLLGKVARPVGQLLAQLITLQLTISTNQDLENAAKMSARLHSYLTLLFGAVR